MANLIAFDLDGVLYSAEPFLGEAYRDAIANVNARRPGSFPYVPTTREILDHVGWPVPVILARLFPHVDPGAVELLYRETLVVISAYVERGAGVLFPDVQPTLAALRRDGFELAIASNGRRRYIESVLTTYGIGGRFRPLITIEDPSVRSKADIIHAHLRQLALPPAAAVMIGDRASDVEAARAVGCAFIGCDYGHGYRDEIAGAGPVVAAFAALPAVITETLCNGVAGG